MPAGRRHRRHLGSRHSERAAAAHVADARDGRALEGDRGEGGAEHEGTLRHEAAHVTRVSLHARDVYDIHSLASQAVSPNPAICVQLDFMKPCPSMVNVAFTLIVTGWLDTYTCDNTARSYDRTSVRDPPLSPRVATNA